jgi:hypothetical protein
MTRARKQYSSLHESSDANDEHHATNHQNPFTMATPAAPIHTEILDECITLLKRHGIKVVTFDMDLTAVAMHSRGRLRRDELDEYLSHATQAFQALVPVLYKHGFKLSIATHSDEDEFGGKIQPATHILGKELATSLVQRWFSSEIASSFCILAYNPRVHPDDAPEDNKIKRYHVRKLREHFEVKPSEILFFDDTEAVVEDCRDTCGVLAFSVNPQCGFRLQDLINNMRRLETKKIKVLTVGDGDLTLSLALARAYGRDHVDLTASVLDANAEELRQGFPDAPLDELKNRNVTVLYGVDATQLHTDRFPGRNYEETQHWDLVCFHHPHLGQKSLMEGREAAHAKTHHKLLCHYLYSASHVSQMVQVCLCGTQPETWRLMEAAEKLNLTLLKEVPTAAPFARVWTASGDGGNGSSQRGDENDSCNNHVESDLPQAALVEPHFPAPRRYRSGKLGSRHFLSKYGYRHRRTEGEMYKGISQDINVSKSVHFVFGRRDNSTRKSKEATNFVTKHGKHACFICECSFETIEALQEHLLAPARPEFTRRKSDSDVAPPQAQQTQEDKALAVSNPVPNQPNINGCKELMSIAVDESCDGKRLRWFLQHKTIKDLSKRKAGSIAKNGLILVNGEVVQDDSRILKFHDNVTMLQRSESDLMAPDKHLNQTPFTTTSKSPQIEVFHRSPSEDWIVVWKPAGIRNKGEYAGTLEMLTSDQEGRRYYSHTQMETSSPGFCILSTSQCHLLTEEDAVSKLDFRYCVTALVHGNVPQDWYPSKSCLATKEAKWRKRKRLTKRKHGFDQSIASDEQAEKFLIHITPKESVSCVDINRDDVGREEQIPAAILTTLHVDTPDPSSGSLCQFFRHSGFPVVGDTFCKTEYWSLKRSIRNRLKDKLCLGCYKMEITFRADMADDKDGKRTFFVEKKVPEKLSAKHWERFLEQESKTLKKV